MKSLTKLWSSFKNISFDNTNLFVTDRLFLEKLCDPESKDSPLYVGINTLSGSVDIFTEQEGLFLERLRKDRHAACDIPKQFLFQLRDRGYIFPSKEAEIFVFDTIVNRFKNLKYSSDKIFPLFAIDTTCPMQCEYCFEKQHLGRSEIFERSVMDKDSLTAAFKALCLLQDLQQKEIEFVGGWGGEPLQEKNYQINELFVALAKQRGFSVGYFSNLALIGSNLSAFLEKNVGSIKFIQTTLDAPSDQHNQYRKIPQAFERTVSTINTLLRIGHCIRVRTNIGPHNINLVPDLAKFYQSQGWFDFPNFKSFVTLTFDRHHDQSKGFHFTEDEALSHWLRLKDEFPVVRKMETFKFVPALYNILRAFGLREAFDVIHDSFEVSIKPMMTYCHLGNRSMYVFTGTPHYSIYNCAECVGLSKFKVGTYYPSIRFYPDKKRMWGIDGNDFYSLRSIDSLEECKGCRGATLCGGHCALEAITANGCSEKIFCKQTPKIITNFFQKEAGRLYKRSRVLLDNSLNLTL